MENKASIFSKQKSRGGERDEEKAAELMLIHLQQSKEDMEKAAGA